MTNHNTPLPTIRRIKQRAAKLKKKLNIPHLEALQKISNEYEFSNWNLFQEELKKIEQAKAPTPAPSTKFIEYDDVEMNDDDYDLLDRERGVDLPETIKKRVTSNKRDLTKLGIEFSVFEPTMTGLKKSILDATQQIRVHFELKSFHHYWEQGQGPAHRVMKEAHLLTDTEVIKSTASLYRPKTKQGDPRIWFRKLPSFAKSGDQVAIIIQDNAVYLINLSTTLINKSLDENDSYIKGFLSSFIIKQNFIADELLGKLKELAKSPLSALRTGDTAIGFTLEERLGIPANSSKLPDYKGIELKSGRGNKTRTTLFAQVADWNISPCKKSAEILNKYGYERENDFKLYCTINAQRENPQGLSFIYDQTKDQLQEWHNKIDLVAIWPGALLRKRLKEKHAETFWVEARSEKIDGIEHFQLLKVTHTKSPILSQLLPLVQSGVITMDHLIKRNGKNNRVSEKGPLFKINKRDLELLFPQPVIHSLV
jgi:hypothetical protein